jgi:cytochrome c-type biogenesis protein CcmH/NrfG
VSSRTEKNVAMMPHHIFSSPQPQQIIVDMANKAKAQEAKNRGNAAFKENRHQEAVAAYSEAIKLDPSDHVCFSPCAGGTVLTPLFFLGILHQPRRQLQRAGEAPGGFG